VRAEQRRIAKMSSAFNVTVADNPAYAPPTLSAQETALADRYLASGREEAALAAKYLASPREETSAPTATLAAPVHQIADPITNQAEPLSAFLMRTNLSQYETALRELGSVEVVHLLDLDQADCEGVGMKPLEARRLLRVASATATQSDV
jgi:hypothetical protein